MKYLNLCLVLVLLAFGALPCTADIHVRDYLDREIVLSAPASRVIALAPHIVENLYSAGAGETLVGAVDYCDYPEAAHKIPRVGSISSFSLEAILALKPDLVIVWYSGNGAKVLDKLQKLKIPAYASNPRTLEDVAKSIRDYGQLTNHTAEAEEAANQYLTTLDNLRQNYNQQRTISVLYQVWNQPLQTLNDEHIISDVIRLCGGKNSFGDAKTIAPKISIESVIERDPDVIIASGMGEERPEWLDMWKSWPQLSAVKNNRLYFIPPDIIQRHTARILSGAELMCQQLNEARTASTPTKKPSN